MALELGVMGPELMGRATELDDIGASLEAAISGAACTLVVSGDPGVGKTALVQHACAAVSSEMWILAGAALPLASMTVPFLPLRSALRRGPVLEGIPNPGLGPGGWAANDVIVAIDDWLTELCLVRPVVLVVDDLQWADQGTLDALMYLIAGPADRRLAILATQRSGELGELHPLQRWLADIRRMPRISWVALEPLDRTSTGAQIAQAMGSAPHQSLVQEVFSRTAGNAYLNRLMVSGLRPETRHLPQTLPEDLKSAVLRSWRGMSDGARQLTQLMAVGGRPIRAQDLAGLSQQAGTRHDAAAILRETTEAGITECWPNGTHWWFHHPMISEVLEQGMESGQRRDWHALFAAYGARLLAQGTTPDFEFMASLAQHHYDAGNAGEAYRWTLRAAAAAGSAGGSNEILRLLHRALALHGQLPQVDESREELLHRLRTAAEAAGAMEDELDALEALLAGLDPAQRPLEVAELLVRRTLLRFSSGLEFFSVDALLQAVRLAEASPESWQYAYALAELAHVGLWKDDPDAHRTAATALEVARKAGNPRALSYALTANSMAALFGERPDEARLLAAQGAAAAVRARDFWALLHATMWQANATEAWSSQAFADLMRSGRQQLSMLGAPHVYLSKMAADEASSYLSIGRWRECGQALRVALGTDPGPLGDVAARLTAARLAALQGSQDEARAHLARAEELFAHKSGYNNLDFDAVRAEVFLAEGDPAAAYLAAMAGAGKEGQPPTMCEWLVPLAARALADMVQGARDEGADTADMLASIDELVARFPSVLRESGNDTPFYSAQVEAFELLYRAETGRARSDAENAAQWIAAADACQSGSLRWEEAYCCWRAVQALLLHGHSGHGQAASFLRRGLILANELHARPLQDSLLEIAARARIATYQPSIGQASGGSIELPGLTVREREILGYVVAGRTYGEIARSLVISEKTVSSHISNMLRKTGTANRLDLSRLATRHGPEHFSPDGRR
ncbi:helix-turn-helix transcriptional regulator [Paeniglutamicibacter psychrophenolicus]|uniref:DNA-binding CsgD family transcriptional regulator/tetratricopeptide (TPR) repeat protein n=1 Tax=Paeniglutamicibacter psychrophenolicus TaxID=257454 RepID=A0ABS4WHT3_9MICC|nr:DNA-binding CsgD family transcriptional regulator/tetratricopeptide (TPR) repeat protein [Paeniglutamicibacter psychrophenolicus]